MLGPEDSLSNGLIDTSFDPPLFSLDSIPLTGVLYYLKKTILWLVSCHRTRSSNALFSRETTVRKLGYSINLSGSKLSLRKDDILRHKTSSFEEGTLIFLESLIFMCTQGLIQPVQYLY